MCFWLRPTFPYEQLIEMDEINPEFPECDVAVIIGANDTCNPAARTNAGPFAGMPIIDADRARTVVIIKRSLFPATQVLTTTSSTWTRP